MSMTTQPLILVTGAARSGVSLVGAIIHLCGARGGVIVKPPQYDGRGAFENAYIRNVLQEPLLRGIGADPKGQFPLPAIERCRAIAPLLAREWAQRVRRTFEDQVRGERDPKCFYASNHTCLVWPVWAAAFPDAKWVVVRRKRESVVHSCLSTGYMDAYQSPEGWDRWYGEHENRFGEMRAAGLDLLDVSMDDVASGSLDGLRAVVDNAGLIWKDADVREFVVGLK